MADAELQIFEVLKTIAIEQGYHKYEVDLKPVSSGGANYTSQLFSITLSAPGKDDLKLFAKVAALEEQLRLISTMQVFETEITFYTNILRKYRELEELHNLSEENKLFSPKFYGGTTEYLKEVLVLEDVSAKGYQSFNRFECFDWEYASSCISSLARLHALSVAFEKDDPRGYSVLVDEFEFCVSKDAFRVFMAKNIETAIKSTDEEYRPKVEKFLRECLDHPTYQKLYYPKKRIVLNHGDLRPSNILHKMGKDGKVQSVLVDYQIIQRGNPVTDLLYFLINGSDEKFRMNHLYEYFENYYVEFSRALARFGIDVTEVLTKEDFDADIKEFLPFGLAIGAFTLPMVTVEPAKAPKPEDGFTLDNMAMEVSDLFLIRFNGLVRDYVKMGIL